MEEWLLASDQVCRELELRHVPDHTTWQRTFQKLRRADLEKRKEHLLAEIGVEEEGIAVDSTGFSPGQASLYYQSRTGRLYQRWLKGVYAVGIASQFILMGKAEIVSTLPGHLHGKWLRREALTRGIGKGLGKFPICPTCG